MQNGEGFTLPLGIDTAAHTPWCDSVATWGLPERQVVCGCCPASTFLPLDGLLVE